MTKQQLQDLNTIKNVKMVDIETLSQDRVYRLGYKHGFNVCRRKFRKVLFGKIKKNV